MTANNGKKPVVLLGEDDPDHAELARELLTRAGNEVRVAENSLELIRKLSERPDAVVLDLIGVASPAVMLALSSMRERPALLVVSADPRLGRRAKELGADGAVPKPYDGHTLATVLEGALTARRLSHAVEAAW